MIENDKARKGWAALEIEPPGPPKESSAKGRESASRFQ